MKHGGVLCSPYNCMSNFHCTKSAINHIMPRSHSTKTNTGCRMLKTCPAKATSISNIC